MQTFVTSKAKENILSRIRKSLSGHKAPMPFPDADKENASLYTGDREAVEENFADAFIQLGGKFVFCENEQEMLDNINMLYENEGWRQLLCADDRILKLFHKRGIDIVEPVMPHQEGADACITSCEMLVARTGSILLSSQSNQGRTASVYYPVHIVFAYADQIVPDIDDAFNVLRKKYHNDLPSMINLATGPSRTADIEKTLVVGVHGPREVYCFFINADSGVFYR